MSVDLDRRRTELLDLRTRVLGAAMVAHGVTPDALAAYDGKLCGPISQVVLRNRGAGPFGLLNLVDERCGGTFENIDDVVPAQERAAVELPALPLGDDGGDFAPGCGRRSACESGHLRASSDAFGRSGRQDDGRDRPRNEVNTSSRPTVDPPSATCPCACLAS